MGKLHHNFFLHCLVKQRNLFISRMYTGKKLIFLSHPWFEILEGRRFNFSGDEDDENLRNDNGMDEFEDDS